MPRFRANPNSVATATLDFLPVLNEPSFHCFRNENRLQKTLRNRELGKFSWNYLLNLWFAKNSQNHRFKYNFGCRLSTLHHVAATCSPLGFVHYTSVWTCHGNGFDWTLLSWFGYGLKLAELFFLRNWEKWLKKLKKVWEQIQTRTGGFNWNHGCDKFTHSCGVQNPEGSMRIQPCGELGFLARPYLILGYVKFLSFSAVYGFSWWFHFFLILCCVDIFASGFF